VPGVGPPLDDCTGGLAAEVAQHRLLGRRVRVDHFPGSLQGAVHGGGGRAQLLGHLGRREPEHLAQDQRRPLSRGQVLKGGDEGELDALAGHVLRLG
jgi:hypothetical protein